jgi:hypothetical protein
MTAARLLRPPSELHADPSTGRFLGAYLVSLLLHALLLIGLAGGWLGSSSPRLDSPPVYMVDLLQKPVLNPQAGRPEPREATPATTATPDASRLSLPDKPPARAADSHVKDALQKLRDEQALQQKIAAMRQGQTVSRDTPVGLPDAKGTEAGVSSLAYVHEFIRENWALSPYLLVDSAKMASIEAWVVLTYGKSGRLEGFRFEKESGDGQFDESIRRALVKSQQLPQPLPARLEEVRVKFNLKEMKALLETRR